MFQDERSESISEASTIKDEEEMSERGSDDDVVHVGCPVKPEQKEPNLATKSSGGEILEAAVQEHQMSNLQENHQITILKLRVLGNFISQKFIFKKFELMHEQENKNQFKFTYMINDLQNLSLRLRNIRKIMTKKTENLS